MTEARIVIASGVALIIAASVAGAFWGWFRAKRRVDEDDSTGSN